MNQNLLTVLFRANLVSFKPASVEVSTQELATSTKIGTFIKNMTKFGYMPNLDVLKSVYSTPEDELASNWTSLKEVLSKETGDSVKMDNFVVYKNFPKEVLEMNESVYWCKQLFIYMGVPAEFMAEVPEPREKMDDNIKYKVLGLANADSLEKIFASLKGAKNRWTDKQAQDALTLQQHFNSVVNSVDFQFKENFLALAVNTEMEKVQIANAMDALRYAYALVVKRKGEVVENLVLDKKTSFKGLLRPQRRFILETMDKCKNLQEDVASRKDVFKQFFYSAHPGDFKVANVQRVYDELYNKKLKSLNAKVQNAINSKNESEVLALLSEAPGVFMRKFLEVYKKFGFSDLVIKTFNEKLHMLSVQQLVKFKKIVETVNDRQHSIYPPRGNWTKAKVVENLSNIKNVHVVNMLEAINKELEKRVEELFPQGVNVDPRLVNVKLPSNDQKLATYGRGTRFEIPSNVKVIRSASYWKLNKTGWFDNGWNFFSADWSSNGTCCWNKSRDGAVFSGDPLNSSEKAGRACQMIDLNIDELKAHGVRYAIWNVLCYSNIRFSEADEVLATLQFCENAQNGKLYEPARAQMVFPLNDNALTKYVAMVDLETREVVYWDANLKGEVSSAVGNQKNGELFKAYNEYANAQPSILDMFVKSSENEDAVKFLFSDESVSLVDSQKAYVFKPLNPDNSFEQIDLGEILK